MANITETLLSQLLSSDSLNGISSATGVGADDITKIIASALPSLLNGANQQSTSENTAASFATALANHAQADTSDLTSFFKNVDATDGAKIVAHLVGNTDTTAEQVAKETGVTKAQSASVLSVVAPLLMSLLGKQSNANSSSNQNDILSAFGSLLGGGSGNSNISSLVTSAVTAYALNALTNKLTGKK
ncbi:MAG: DUF937 domain-containing protein [Erysipelotrichaceae bacterium]|nr:DUF937 domain-containing protein [Erysipelotrichaceae bacterium]